MNKVKMFFIAAAMLLTTAGVFAGKAKFATASVNNLYYHTTGSNYVEFGAQITGNPLIYFTSGTPTGTQSTIVVGGVSYSVYTNNTGSLSGYSPAY